MTIPAASARSRVMGVNSLDFGGDLQTPHACRRELPGVDVGDLLQGMVDVPNVIAFHHQDGLRGVEVILEDRRWYHRRERPMMYTVPWKPYEGQPKSSPKHLPV